MSLYLYRTPAVKKGRLGNLYLSPAPPNWLRNYEHPFRLSLPRSWFRKVKNGECWQVYRIAVSLFNKDTKKSIMEINPINQKLRKIKERMTYES